MSDGTPSNERAMLESVAAVVAGGGLLLWSAASLARSRTRPAAILVALAGAALVARGVGGSGLLLLAGALRRSVPAGGAREEGAGLDGGFDDPVDVASMDSFPASDPPSTSGATAHITRRGLERARAKRHG
jgi:hypothetical protein